MASGYKEQFKSAVDTDFWHAVTIAAVAVCADVYNEPAGLNEIQSVGTTGNPTGGTFTLTFGGQTTAALPRNADAPAIQAALEALSSIGAGGVRVTGGPLPTAVQVEFRGLNTTVDVPLMTATSGLTGGTSPTVAIAVVRAGQPGATNHANRERLMRAVLNDPETWGKRLAYGVAMLGATHNPVPDDAPLKAQVAQVFDAYAGLA